VNIRETLTMGILSKLEHKLDHKQGGQPPMGQSGGLGQQGTACNEPFLPQSSASHVRVLIS